VCAFVLVNAKVIASHLSLCEAWDDDGYVPTRSDHRVLAVKATLTGYTAVRVDIGHNGATGLATQRPERTVAAPVKDDDPGRQRLRIKVVVVSDALDVTPLTDGSA
jgi:hypothetical protein